MCNLGNQSVGRSKFEDVVVKNFEDPMSDGIIKRNGWRDVYIDARRYGEAVNAGIEEARDDLILRVRGIHEISESFVHPRHAQIYRRIWKAHQR